ncbi:MAG TPA: hypothetical protein VFL80_01155 [Thermoanaerobaculia bacterium]|nr:hypothetical protein [Thermoanaerobaculia bacterium]
MNVDYASLAEDVMSGSFRQRLEEELLAGFREIDREGERLPPASHYASRIAEIINQGAPVPLSSTFAYELYQEVLAACEGAAARVREER